MSRTTPTWSIYRRIDLDDGAHLVLAGTVAAEFEGQAAALAALLPEAPAYPVLCRGMAGRTPTLTLADLPQVVELPVVESRRNRRRRAFAAAAVAQSQGMAA